MKSSTKNRAKGVAKEAKGRLKETVGHATRNPRLARKGQAEAAGGRVRRRAGELEEDVEHAVQD